MYTLVSVPGSWHRVSKSLGNSWVIGAYFVLMRQILMGSWVTSGWGLVTRKTQPWLEASSPTHCSLGKEEEVDTKLTIDRVYIMKPSQKFQKYKVLRASRLLNMQEYRGGGMLVGGTPTFISSPISCPTHLFHLHLSAYSKPLNKCFPEFCEPL